MTARQLLTVHTIAAVLIGYIAAITLEKAWGNFNHDRLERASQ